MASFATPGNFECNLADHLAVGRIDDGHRAADFGDTQSCVPAVLNIATRGRLSTSTLSNVSLVVVSMKCAMFVVSDVLTSTCRPGSSPMPSGSTPTGMSEMTAAFVDVDDGDEVVVLVGDVKRIAAEDAESEVRGPGRTAAS